MSRSKIRPYIAKSLIFILLPFFILGLTACGDQSSSETSTILLFADPDVLPANGNSSAQIRAELYNSLGEPVDKNTRVVFQTNLGTFRNGEKKYTVRTNDESGLAIVQLHAGKIPGNAEVQAISNGVRQNTRVRFADPTKVESIELGTGSDSVIADGLSHVAVFLRVTSPEGDPVEGLTVNFTTTLGGLSTVNPAEVESQNGSIPAISTNPATSAVTGVDGEARVWLVSGTKTGTAAITAEVKGLVETANVMFVAGKPVSIVLRSAPETIRPGGTTDVIARIVDANDNPVEGEEIVFEILQNDSGGFLASVSAETDVNGETVVNYTAGSEEGTDRIRARSRTDVSVSDITDIIIDASAIVVQGLTVLSGTDSLVADGISDTLIRATVVDMAGNPAPGIEVEFNTTIGTLLGSTTVTTDANGFADVILQSVVNTGTAKVSAKASGFIATVNVAFISDSPESIFLQAAPETVNPEDTSTLTATVTDINGNPISGETVSFSFVANNSGASLSAPSAVTDINGEATIIYIAGSESGTDTLRARSTTDASVLGDVDVVVDPDAIVVQGVTVISGSALLVADGVSDTLIRATVIDTAGNPASGIDVEFSTTLGTLLGPTTVTTDANGLAEVTLQSAANTGTATVAAKASGFIASVGVSFVAEAPKMITLNAAPETVNPRGSSTLRATVRDTNGNLIAGETVTFNFVANNSGASLSAPSAVTDINGEATIIYIAGSESGTDTLRARSTTDASVLGDVDVVVDPDAIVVQGVTVISGSALLVADGVSDTLIRATVIDTAGNPASGIDVEFSTTLGTLLGPTTVTTDANGLAEVTLQSAANTGTATVAAKASGFIDKVSVAFEAGAPNTLLVNAAPNTLNPGDTSQIMARVSDANGNAVAGETINFNISINNSGAILETVSAVTNVNGKAIVNYTAGTIDTVADTITAMAASNGITGTTNVNVDASVVVVGSVSVIAGTDELLADGVSQTMIRATVLDINGNPVSSRIVNFETTAGSLSSLSALTDENGFAEVFLTSPTNRGLTTVRAEASGFIASITINCIAGPADHLYVIAAPETVHPDGSIELIAVAEDSNDNRLFDEYMSVIIRDSFGNIVETRGAETEEDGVMRMTLTAFWGIGDFDITVSTNNGKSATTTVTVDPSAIVVAGVTVVSGASSLPADGTSDTLIRATVVDTSGNPASGIDVEFDTTLGTLLGATTVATDANGIAEVTLQSVANTGTATVSAKASGFIGTVDVLFVAEAPAAIVLNAAPETVNPGGTSTLTATVTDGNGNLVAGETVNFNFAANASSASLSAASAVTNVNGEATITYIAGSEDGTDTVRARSASDASVWGTQNIVVDSSAIVVAGVTVVSGASSLPADGTSDTLIRATVVDTSGNPASGIDVEFDTTLGTLLGATTVATDANGIAEVTLQSVANTGTATVSAKASGFIGTVNVAFAAGAPNAIDLNTTPSAVRPNGASTLTATLTDDNGNPLPGETISFTFDTNNSGATLSAPSAVTNINGQATITYTAGADEPVQDIIRAISVTDSSISITVVIDVDASLFPVIIRSLTLTAANEEIVADGMSATAIRATIVDIDGNPVSGKNVNFTASYGVLTPSTATTGSNGIAEVLLSSEFSSGLSLVSASIAEGHSDQISVRFIPGPPDDSNSSITVQPATIPADGVSEAVVTVTLADANDNPVQNDTEILLYTSKGTIISDNPANTVSGRAEFTIQAAGSPGTAEISLWDYPDIPSASLAFGALPPGIPASIVIESVSHTEIAVTGVGKNDNSAVTVRVIDGAGDTVTDPDITLDVSLLAKPHGGEFLSGETSTGAETDTQQLEIITHEGIGTFNLRSGVLPGVVEIRIEVLDGSASLTPPVVTVIPQISIASGPPHTLVLSAPTLNAVVNLNDGPDSGIPQTPGFYSRRAGLIVTDRYGNSVPDGTVINLGVLDSVISEGDDGETMQDEDRLTDATRFGDGFLGIYIDRDGMERYIQPNDRVLLFNAPPADKSRFIAPTIGGVDYLDVTKAYKTDGEDLEYIVGASLLGGAIYGTDGTSATKGTVQTENGLAQLRLVYPANRNKILVGCYANLNTDIRFSQPWSARVISVFTSTDEAALIDEGTLCFSSIAGWTITAAPGSISLPVGSSANVSLTLEDGGDEIRLPFVPISASVYSEDGVTLTVSTGPTDVNGNFTSTVTETGGVSGDATITYYAGDAMVQVVVTVTTAP